MPRKKTNPNFMNGVPELVLLKLLSKKEMYGYEIIWTIKEASKQTFAFGEGCIYPVLHNLQKEGCLKTRNQVVQGRNRIFYLATKKGKERLKELTSEWTRISMGISNIWEGRR